MIITLTPPKITEDLLFYQKYELENKIQNYIYQKVFNIKLINIKNYMNDTKKNFLNKILSIIYTDKIGVYIDFDVYIFNYKYFKKYKNYNFICKYTDTEYDWYKKLSDNNLKIHPDILKLKYRYRGTIFNITPEFKNNLKIIFKKYYKFYDKNIFKYSWIFEELILSEAYELLENKIFLDYKINDYYNLSIMHYNTNFLLNFAIKNKLKNIIKDIFLLEDIYKKIKRPKK